MADLRDMARDPAHRRAFEKLLYLAARRGDADLVAERLAWGVDPNCTFSGGRTPLMANIRGPSPGAAVARALLDRGADPGLTDDTGLTALDHARRKLARLQARPVRRHRSRSLDENDQLRLSPGEQDELDGMRRELGDDAREAIRIWLQERLRAARRVFNDPAQLEKIVEMLEVVAG